MNFFEKNLAETLEAINKLIDNNIREVNVKRIRRCNNITSSNRSKINFIWRALHHLEELHVLEKNGVNKPQTYKIKVESKINIEDVIVRND